MQIGNDLCITKIEALQVKNYYDYYYYGACQLPKGPNPTSINTKGKFYNLGDITPKNAKDNNFQTHSKKCCRKVICCHCHLLPFHFTP
ncbi:hypothetical protein CDAR_121281 [Caerostris darwini]|uniref:Uncharacterized protein n=1 Tax=Caerostris darwini TaxID=1538125 RepID=A0AAV4VHL9_9ARAC|nr:hypothetical protein CDAR_121281 [Caerostris darwini]